LELWLSSMDCFLLTVNVMVNIFSSRAEGLDDSAKFLINGG
jgi:hypothetical protein